MAVCRPEAFATTATTFKWQLVQLCRATALDSGCRYMHCTRCLAPVSQSALNLNTNNFPFLMLFCLSNHAQTSVQPGTRWSASLVGC